MNSDQYEVHIIERGDSTEEVDECRAQFTASPTEFNKLRLASALLADSQYGESATLYSQVAQKDTSRILHLGSATYAEAFRQEALAVKRARSIYEEEARQIPGEDSFRITMEAYERLVSMFDEEMKNAT